MHGLREEARGERVVRPFSKRQMHACRSEREWRQGRKTHMAGRRYVAVSSGD